jgi:hypothetical protein
MSEKQERLQILEMIQSGVISASEGARLLRALEGDPDGEGFSPSAGSEEEIIEDPAISSARGNREEVLTGNSRARFEPEIEKWKRWWMIPVWIGVGITVIGALLLLWAYQSSGFSFWFGCAWLPLLLGLGVIAMAWGSRTGRWLHLRVQQQSGEWPRTFAFSFPIPLRFTSWILRTFGHFVPDLREHGVDVGAVIQAFEKTTGPDTPFYLEVDEGEGREKVQIYIG